MENGDRIIRIRTADVTAAMATAVVVVVVAFTVAFIHSHSFAFSFSFFHTLQSPVFATNFYFFPIFNLVHCMRLFWLLLLLFLFLPTVAIAAVTVPVLMV